MQEGSKVQPTGYEANTVGVCAEGFALSFFQFSFLVFIFTLSTQDGDSALILAARYGRTDVVVELVKAGANLNLQNEVHTLSILHSSYNILSKIIHCHFHYDTQNGDSAVIRATVEHQPATLRELVRAGSDLNLQNQVRYTVTVDTAPHIIPSCLY